MQHNSLINSDIVISTDKTTLKSTTIESTTTSMSTTTTTKEIITTSTTADEYDYEDEDSGDDDDWWNILDPTDYDIIGENCTTINGKEFCWPIYRYNKHIKHVIH